MIEYILGNEELESQYIFDKYGVSLYYPHATDEDIGSAYLLVSDGKGKSHTMSKPEIEALKEKIATDLNKVRTSLAVIRKISMSSSILSDRKKVEEIEALEDEEVILEQFSEQLLRAKGVSTMQLKHTDKLYVLCAEDTCSHERHYIQDVLGIIDFYGKPAKSFFLRRCANCKQFQLLWDDFERMWHSYGIPQVDIVYVDDDGEDEDYLGFPAHSIFSKLGYSVAQDSGLTREMRQAILKYAILDGKVTKAETLRYLRRRLNINGMKKSNESAAMKWQDDLEFIMEL